MRLNTRTGNTIHHLLIPTSLASRVIPLLCHAGYARCQATAPAGLLAEPRATGSRPSPGFKAISQAKGHEQPPFSGVLDCMKNILRYSFIDYGRKTFWKYADIYGYNEPKGGFIYSAASIKYKPRRTVTPTHGDQREPQSLIPLVPPGTSANKLLLFIHPGTSEKTIAIKSDYIYLPVAAERI
ncbi:hypothetical protein Bbelb_418180 [Branchiostoma belcheri]|nr:hypothetical protein Bbelb_418180 [Branchiostoma belcheri]